jgi:hypothetical protein
MFGITNCCNLTCHFCSRDLAGTSEWTVASALAVRLSRRTYGRALLQGVGQGTPRHTRHTETDRPPTSTRHATVATDVTGGATVSSTKRVFRRALPFPDTPKRRFKRM